MILYRVISLLKKEDFDIDGIFRTADNTLEVKQFFLTKEAINQYLSNVQQQNFDPTYTYLLVIHIDDTSFSAINKTQLPLDGYDAVSIDENDLRDFNDCVIFVEQEAL